MKRILVTFNNFDIYCPEAYHGLQEQGFTFLLSESNVPCTFEQIRQVIGEADALIAGLETLDERVFAIAPRLKLIARMGVGYDRIDVEAARRHGIAVTNTRGNNALSVAEQSLGMILSVYRNLHQLNALVHQGQWPRYLGHALSGQTVGLIGFGDIAQRLAQLLKGFGVRIIACRRSGAPTPAAADLGVRMTDFETVLRESDVVSLHVPAIPENIGLMGREQFAAMKRGAVFINTARGCLIDSLALLEAVRSGHLSGAAVDVYSQEPPDRTEPLLQDPRILCTPHSASETAESYRCGGAMIMRQITDVFAGRAPENWLNP